MTDHAAVLSEVDAQIRAIVQRWPALSLERATHAAPEVRACAQQCVDLEDQLRRAASAATPASPPLQDLGPAAALDQLRATWFEALSTVQHYVEVGEGRVEAGHAPDEALTSQLEGLATRLCALRESLYDHSHPLAAPHTEGL